MAAEMSTSIGTIEGTRSRLHPPGGSASRHTRGLRSQTPPGEASALIILSDAGSAMAHYLAESPHRGGRRPAPPAQRFPIISSFEKM